MDVNDAAFQVSGVRVAIHTTGGHQRVGIHAPVISIVVLSDRLDQITVGGTHANPERQIARVVRWRVGQVQGSPGFSNVGVG